MTKPNITDEELIEIGEELKKFKAEKKRAEKQIMQRQLLSSLRKEENNRAKTINEELFEKNLPKVIRFLKGDKGRYTVYARKNSETLEFEPLFTTKDFRNATNATALQNTLCATEEWEDFMAGVIDSYQIAPGPGPKDPISIAFWKDALTYFSNHPRLVKLNDRLPTFSNSREEDCVICFPLDKLTPGRYDNIRQFLKRLDYPDHFMAWVASVFLAHSKNSQVLWLQGNGNDGKTIIINLIVALLQEIIKYKGASASVDENNLDSPFIYSNLSSCRLVTFSDVKYLNLLDTPFIHKVTGNDLVASEEKYEAKVQETVFCKVAITSNYSPVMEKVTNQLRRILRIKVSPTGSMSKDLTWEEEVKKEMPHFVYACLKKYPEIIKGEMIVPEDEDYLVDVGSHAEQIFEEICNKRFTFEDNSYAYVTDVMKALNKTVKEFGMTNTNYIIDKFTRYLKTKYDVNKIALTRDSDKRQITLFKGMRMAVSVNISEWKASGATPMKFPEEEEVCPL
jgi:hypothetical protein